MAHIVFGGKTPRHKLVKPYKKYFFVSVIINIIQLILQFFNK